MTTIQTLLLRLWLIFWPQYVPTVPFAATSGSTAITLDASCTGSNSAAIIVPCSSGMTVTAGDTITCQAYTNGGSFDPSNLVFFDSINGYYSGVYGYNHPTSTANDWVAAAVFENSASGTMTPQVRNYEANGIGLSCQAWKGTPTSGVLDGGAGGITKSATAANPTSGTAAAPTNANAVGICQMVRGTAASTSAGTGMSPTGILTGVTQTLAQYFEYQIQTTATTLNCPYTSASAAYRDTQFFVTNTSTPGGYRGLTGTYGVPANAQTNGASATLAIMNTLSGATAGSVTTLNGNNASGAPWAFGSGSAVTFDTSVAPLGSLKLLVGGQPHVVGDAATSLLFPGANTTTGYQTQLEGMLNTGAGMWVGAFFRLATGATSTQVCDVMDVRGGVTDTTNTFQISYLTGSGIGYDIEAGNGSTNTKYYPGAVLGQDYFTILHMAGVNDANNDIYILSQVTPGSGPWTVLGHMTKAVTGGTVAATTTGSVTAGSTALTVASGTSIAAGQSVAMSGVQAGTTVASGSGTSWVMSQAASTTQTSVTAKFWAATGGASMLATIGKYGSCNLSSNMWTSGFIFDPYGVLLPLIAAGTISL